MIFFQNLNQISIVVSETRAQRELHQLFAGNVPDLSAKEWTAQLLAHLLYVSPSTETMAETLASFRQMYVFMQIYWNLNQYDFSYGAPSSSVAYELAQLYAGEADVGDVVDAAIAVGNVSIALVLNLSLFLNWHVSVGT